MQAIDELGEFIIELFLTIVELIVYMIKLVPELIRLYKPLIDVAFLVLVVAALVMLVAPRLLATDLLIVLSQSMEPTLPMGSLVFMREVEPSDVQVGDMITFKMAGPDGSPSLVTHRVIEVMGSGIAMRFRTKGDAVEDPDQELVKAMDLVGRVAFSLPWAGYFISFIRTPIGYAVLVGMPVAFLISSEVVAIARMSRESSLQRASGSPAGQEG